MENYDKLIKEIKETAGQYKYYLLIQDTGSEIGIIRTDEIRVDKDNNVYALRINVWEPHGKFDNDFKSYWTEIKERTIDEVIRII